MVRIFGGPSFSRGKAGTMIKLLIGFINSVSSKEAIHSFVELLCQAISTDSHALLMKLHLLHLLVPSLIIFLSSSIQL